MENPGDYLVLYEPETRHVRFIQSGDKGAGISSHVSGHLLVHSKRAYLALANASGISVSRVERIVFENPNIMPLERSRQICDMLIDYRR
jgi:filamentous hemagglutinin family protein